MKRVYDHKVAILVDSMTLASYLKKKCYPLASRIFASDEPDLQQKLQEYAIIIVRLGLRNLDGLTLTKRLKEENTAKVILISSDRENGTSALLAGADHFLTFPFQGHELWDKVQSSAIAS